MTEEQWGILVEIAGSFKAEILRGSLEAQGISVVLSQEGAGHSALPVTVGLLGQVQVLVPEKDLERARKVLNDYNSGVYEDQPPFEETGDTEEADSQS